MGSLISMLVLLWMGSGVALESRGQFLICWLFIISDMYTKLAEQNFGGILCPVLLLLCAFAEHTVLCTWQAGGCVEGVCRVQGTHQSAEPDAL